MLAAFAASPSTAFAAGERERGLRLAREGRCLAALPDLARARARDPRDAEASLVVGQCLMRLERYDEALAALEVARAVNPVLDGVDISLAITHYHLEEPGAARAALDRAEARSPDRANVQLYRGLLLLDAAEHEAGVRALERARALDPGYAEPVASFYQGLALAEIDERDAARTALERVVDEWPGPAWADEAAAALERLGRKDDRWWLNASIGVEFDTNVVLKGSGVDLPNDISDDVDWRGVWTASAGATLLSHPQWTLGVMGGYYGTEEDDVSEFDTHYPTASVWLDHPWSDTLVSRLRYEFGYAWVDEDPYLLSHRGVTSLYQTWNDWGRTELFARYEWDDYRFDNADVPDGNGAPGSICPNLTFCGPPGLNESSARNRDGYAVTAGIEHGLEPPDFGPFSSEVHGGYAYTWRDTRGREYDHQQHAFSLGGGLTFPLDFVLAVDVTYAYRPYDKPSTFPDPDGLLKQYALDEDDREEHQWTLAASLSKAITEQLGLSAFWRFDDNDSNVAVFDYDRHVVGLKLTGSLGP